eukprot:1159183-Pelagomonas_calceolata.AAC.10
MRLFPSHALAMQLTYYLRGLHGMGYVLSKRALLQLAADLASYPDLQRLAAKVRVQCAPSCFDLCGVYTSSARRALQGLPSLCE